VRSIASSAPAHVDASARASTARVVVRTAVTMGCFAANSLLCRAALATGRIDPGAFTAIRVGSGALTLALLAALRGVRPTAGNWGSAVTLAVYAITFAAAYVRLQAGTGALVLFAAVQATMIAWSIARGVRPSRRQATGIVLALLGLVYLVAPGISRPDPAGAALMAIAGAGWGVYSLRGRTEADPVAANAGNFLRALPLVLALLAISTRSVPSASGAALAVASGVVATGIGYVLWYGVLPALGATRAAVVQLSVPVLAALGAVVLLPEPLSLRLIGSGIAVLAGIALVVARPRAR
jgi:drug/metabolite transporter (DMT)-like permease